MKNKRYKVLRGGSFDYEPGISRCASRYWDSPSLPGWLVGFRVCCGALAVRDKATQKEILEFLGGIVI